MNKPLKIAIYSGEIPSTTFIERLVLGLSEKGHTIYLFGFNNGKTSYPSKIKVVAYKHSWLSKLMHLVYYGFLLLIFKSKDKRKLDDFLEQENRNSLYAKVKYYPVLWHQPDIFHVQWAKSLSEWAWVQDFGMTLVLSLRGAHINYSPIANKQLATQYREHFPKVDAFHAVSKAIAKEAEMYGADASRTQVVYSGLDLKAFELSDAKKPSQLQIISVGRPHWIKGYTYAVDACKLLKDKNVAFNYTIVGASTDLELVYQINDLKLSNEVKLTKPIEFDKVKQMIHSADILLLPSLKEGIANVVLEAMTMGTVVVSTDCGGIDEVIEDGINGYLVPIRDSKALAEKLQQVMILPIDKKESVIANAKRTIEKQHQTKHMVEGMEALYQSVLKSKKV